MTQPPQGSDVREALRAFDIEVSGEACKTLLQHLDPDPETGECSPIRIQAGNGHSGAGLYLSAPDYPEEGSVLLAALAVPSAQADKQRALELFGSLDVTTQREVAEYVRAMYPAASQGTPAQAEQPAGEHYEEIKATLKGAHAIMESLSAIERRVGPVGSHARGYTHKITKALKHLDALASQGTPSPEAVWPIKPLKLVQVELPDGSEAMCRPSRAVFDAYSMQQLENQLRTTRPAQSEQKAEKLTRYGTYENGKWTGTEWAPAPEPTTADTSPIVRIKVDEDGKIIDATFYAPGLPSGEHDLWPVRVTLTEEDEALMKAAESLVRAANKCAEQKAEAAPSVGPDSGFVCELLHDPTMTHAAYFAAIRDYLDKPAAALAKESP